MSTHGLLDALFPLSPSPFGDGERVMPEACSKDRVRGDRLLNTCHTHPRLTHPALTQNPPLTLTLTPFRCAARGEGMPLLRPLSETRP